MIALERVIVRYTNELPGGYDAGTLPWHRSLRQLIGVWWGIRQLAPCPPEGGGASQAVIDGFAASGGSVAHVADAYGAADVILIRASGGSVARETDAYGAADVILIRASGGSVAHVADAYGAASLW